MSDFINGWYGLSSSGNYDNNLTWSTTASTVGYTQYLYQPNHSMIYDDYVYEWDMMKVPKMKLNPNVKVI